jgi:hypothetical protein
MKLRQMATDLEVASRLGARVLRRRFRGELEPEPDLDAWRATLERWLAQLPAGVLREHRFVELPATRPPWTDSGLALQPGDAVTWFAAGRVHLSRPLDIWVDPSFQLWGRVGERGTVFRGTRSTHTFAASESGTLQLANYFPGEWNTPQGDLGHGADDYGRVSGHTGVLLLAWHAGVEPEQAIAALSAQPDAPAPVRDEAARLASPRAAPDGWDHLWYLGPSEIYRPSRTEDGAPAVSCTTHGDVAILRRAAAVPLEPGVALEWRWRVDRLPSLLREDSLPSHDYLSIAVEFDDGQDLTYYWSAELPVGTVYRCPLPTWADKETHVVVRRGTSGLGQWLPERRDLHDDYRRHIGGKASSVVRVWLIANSLFQRGQGRCEYSAITIGRSDGSRLEVL